jgi:hypothetical protein
MSTFLGFNASKNCKIKPSVKVISVIFGRNGFTNGLQAGEIHFNLMGIIQDKLASYNKQLQHCLVKLD